MVHKYYQFNVDKDKNPKLVLTYADAICTAFRREGLYLAVESRKLDDGSTDVTAHAVFEPDPKVVMEQKGGLKELSQTMADSMELPDESRDRILEVLQLAYRMGEVAVENKEADGDKRPVKAGTAKV